jgi:hypothetical protein
VPGLKRARGSNLRRNQRGRCFNRFRISGQGYVFRTSGIRGAPDEGIHRAHANNPNACATIALGVELGERVPQDLQSGHLGLRAGRSLTLEERGTLPDPEPPLRLA